MIDDNYYIRIRNNVIRDEEYKIVKDYSINKSDINTYYEIVIVIQLV